MDATPSPCVPPQRDGRAPCEALFRGMFASDAVNEDSGVLWS